MSVLSLIQQTASSKDITSPINVCFFKVGATIEIQSNVFFRYFFSKLVVGGKLVCRQPLIDREFQAC